MSDSNSKELHFEHLFWWLEQEYKMVLAEDAKTAMAQILTAICPADGAGIATEIESVVMAAKEFDENGHPQLARVARYYERRAASMYVIECDNGRPPAISNFAISRIIDMPNELDIRGRTVRATIFENNAGVWGNQ